MRGKDLADAADVLIIMGSVRAGRRCPEIAQWILQIANTYSDLCFDLVDLRDWPLPMDDEPGIPATGDYTKDHTLNWSRKIAAAKGFVIVTPQYNWGYPAALKNALDHLYREWRGKPVAIVTYGGHGGDKCAAQLRQVTEGMAMRPLPTMPAITLTGEMIGGGRIDPETDFAGAEDAVRQVIAELVSAIDADS